MPGRPCALPACEKSGVRAQLWNCGRGCPALFDPATPLVNIALDVDHSTDTSLCSKPHTGARFQLRNPRSFVSAFSMC